MRTALIVIVTAIGLGAVALVGIEQLASFATMQVLFLVVSLSALMVAGVWLRPERRMPLLCDPFLLSCLFLAQFYLIGPIIMAVWGLSPVAFFRAPDIRDAVPPLLGCLLMVSCAIIGYRMAFGAMIADGIPDFRGSRSRLPRKALIAVLVTVCIAGGVWWIQYQGGFFAKLGTAYGAGKAGAAFNAIWNLLLVATLVWGWHLIDSPRPSRRQTGLFLGYLVAVALFYGVLLGVRKYLFFLFFGLLACWALRRGVRTLPKTRVAIVFIVLMAFFTVWGSIRTASVAELMGMEGKHRVARDRDLREGYFSGVADPFGTAALVWQVFPQQEPHRYGQTLLVTVFLFVPRALWPEKPVGIGKELTRYYVGPFYEPTEGYSVTPTLPADLYLNFGWVGVAIGGLLLGVVFRVAVSYAMTGASDGVQRNGARVLLPALFLMGLGEVRADMAQLLALYVMTIVPLVLLLVLFRLDERGPRTEAVSVPAA